MYDDIYVELRKIGDVINDCGLEIGYTSGKMVVKRPGFNSIVDQMFINFGKRIRIDKDKVDNFCTTNGFYYDSCRYNDEYVKYVYVGVDDKEYKMTVSKFKSWYKHRDLQPGDSVMLMNKDELIKNGYKESQTGNLIKENSVTIFYNNGKSTMANYLGSALLVKHCDPHGFVLDGCQYSFDYENIKYIIKKQGSLSGEVIVTGKLTTETTNYKPVKHGDKYKLEDGTELLILLSANGTKYHLMKTKENKLLLEDVNFYEIVGFLYYNNASRIK